MPTILVVDDEEQVRNLLAQFLSKKNYSVLRADSAEAGIAVLEKEKVDAVLLDIVLPGLNGLEALRKIQASWPDLPVIMVSGQDEEELAKETLKAGAFDYLVKPLDFQYLEKTLYMKLIERLA